VLSWVTAEVFGDRTAGRYEGLKKFCSWRAVCVKHQLVKEELWLL
jgi:hypothetical protein